MMQTLPPCGLGGAPASDGECVGSSGSPNDAGGAVFSGLSSSHVASGLVAAGAILAGLLFAIWAVRKVSRFFGSRVGSADELTPDGFLQKHGALWRGSLSADAEFTGYGRGDAYSDADFAARLEALAPGQSWCMACDLVYESDEFGCPCCGRGRRDFGDDSDTEDDSPDDEPDEGRGELRLEHGK